MNELDKLIEEFKVTLSKFEAIASRMEERIAATEAAAEAATELENALAAVKEPA